LYSVADAEKAHIFLPLTMFFGASCLTAQNNRTTDDIEAITGGFRLLESNGGPRFGGEIQSCLEALRKMQSFNNLAKDHLGILERQDFMPDYR